jgi:predicted NACHT family NTPase
MVKRSLQASLTGIQQAKRAFALKGWTQDNLAAEVNLKTRQAIWRFFSGRPIERHTFIEICMVLSLNWREIATVFSRDTCKNLQDGLESVAIYTF